MSEDRFERLIYGTYFGENERLNYLLNKSKEKGLKGDEVFEFIHLDRKELQTQLQTKDALIKELTKANTPSRVMELLVKPLENENKALREILTISVTKECKCKNNTEVNIEVIKRNLELRDLLNMAVRIEN